MKVLIVPDLPRSIRELIRGIQPAEHDVAICSEFSDRYADELAGAECLMGLPRLPIDAELASRGPNLRFVQQLRKGTDKVDLPAMARAGIEVSTVGDLTAPSVAEHTLMLMLSVCRRLRWQHQTVVDGDWLEAKPWQKRDESVDASPYEPISGLDGMTLGLFGLGAIGRRVARLASAFGMRAQATTRTGEPGTERDGIPLVRFDELLRTSDVVSLHALLTPENKHIFNREAFAQMKRGAFLINTARGGLVEEPALLEALDAGTVAGAGLDTLGKEPPDPDNPLLSHDRVVLTPHTAWLSAPCWQQIFRFGFENLGRFQRGEAIENRVE